MTKHWHKQSSRLILFNLLHFLRTFFTIFKTNIAKRVGLIDFNLRKKTCTVKHKFTMAKHTFGFMQCHIGSLFCNKFNVFHILTNTRRDGGYFLESNSRIAQLKYSWVIECASLFSFHMSWETAVPSMYIQSIFLRFVTLFDHFTAIYEGALAS